MRLSDALGIVVQRSNYHHIASGFYVLHVILRTHLHLQQPGLLVVTDAITINIAELQIGPILAADPTRALQHDIGIVKTCASGDIHDRAEAFLLLFYARSSIWVSCRAAQLFIFPILLACNRGDTPCTRSRCSHCSLIATEYVLMGLYVCTHKIPLAVVVVH